MITSGALKEFVSEVAGIGVILEDDESHSARVKKERGYHLRRYEMASDAAGDYAIREKPGPARASVQGFLVDVAQDLTAFDPSTISRKRWLNIMGSRVPLPSIKSK